MNYSNNQFEITKHRGSPTLVFLWWGILGGCEGLAGERPCGGMILIKLQSKSVGTRFHMSVLMWVYSVFLGSLLEGVPLEDCFWMKLYSCITFSVKLLIKSRCRFCLVYFKISKFKFLHIVFNFYLYYFIFVFTENK